MSDPGVQDYDVVVVGAGIAGLTAAATASAFGLRVVVLEQLGPGGQLLDTTVVDCEFDLMAERPAADLAAAVMERAMNAGAALEFATVSKLATGDRHVLETDAGSYSARAVILAMGATPLRLDIPGESQFAGRGVSYCVPCDGPLFRDQPVVLLGAGRYAVKEANELSELASEITVVSLDDGRSDRAWADSLEIGGKLHLIRDARAVSIDGDADGVRSVRLADSDREWQLSTRAIFVCAGRAPASELVQSIVELDADGRILTDSSLNTGITGLYAAGDIRAHSPERLISAAADGVTAATAVARRAASQPPLSPYTSS